MSSRLHRPAKVDANQRDIVKAFEKLGCNVTDLSLVGKGCPDLLVDKDGMIWLVEVKNKEGRNILTPAQLEFISNTSIDVDLVRNVDDVFNLVNWR